MDAVIVLFVVFCVIGIVLRVGVIGFSGKEAPLDRYQIRFSVSDIAATSEKAMVAGDTLRLVRQGQVLGTLIGLESVSSAKVYVEKYNGEIALAEYPAGTRIDVVGVILAEGTAEEKGFLLGGTFLLSPGVEYQVQSEHMDLVLKILDIQKMQ